MTVATTIGFVLQCKTCKEEFLVDGTAEFTDKRSGREMVAYWSPGLDRPVVEKIVGFSLGTGDTFQCFGCRALEWIEEIKNDQDRSH